MSQCLFTKSSQSSGTPVETVGERERETAGRVNTMAAAFCVDCRLKLTGQYFGKCGRDYGASVVMQEPGDDDNNNEEDLGGRGGGGGISFILR